MYLVDLIHQNLYIYDFFPKKKGRLKYIKYIVNSEIPVFIYESVYRIKKLINQIKEEGFEGKISINREISKIYEQKITDNIDKIIDKLDNGEIKIKGEFVVGFFNTKGKC
ncbi:Ribosomal RNA small subunit methyltransferase I [Candidatus Vampirococcus lugosii]|uniref:Ribosomal RNA small subunit methyltransferase I n=1 Tax=Candidatus Vampirococcus lugosii TaxID=2789015 RepID=A0ABS5QLT5_9BACT|nr:Ribosomal RNA small subunit methyltransferase I [Candidatus Vampirococcus lugosii]